MLLVGKGEVMKDFFLQTISRCVYKLNTNGCISVKSGFGGLEVACWPLVPKFAGSNPADTVSFFRAKKLSARLPSEGK